VEPRRYRVDRLGHAHDRAAFSCGEESLDAYLRQRARQDADRHAATTFVLVDDQERRIAGYYTLRASAVHLEDLPPETRRTLPRYPLAPVILLGRLAIDRDYQDQHLGEALLFNALRRAYNVGTREIAAMAVVVDALHDRARAFYERYGSQRLPDNELRLFLPMQTIGHLLEDDEG
jgi:ribosomal protein S18 acetylase RimI-like enzyme